MPRLPSPAQDLARKVAHLRNPATYPEQPAHVDTIETHMSWLFLTETHVYKLKKPVHYDFLDFSTLAARRMNCQEEFRLNQALAPGVYLGVVPLTIAADGALKVQGGGAVVEWLVKMRRLPAARMLDRLIRSGELQQSEIERLAQVLIDFYRKATPVTMTGAAYRAEFERMIALNHSVLGAPRYGLSREILARVHDALARTVRDGAAQFDQRIRDGRVVEAHGDLRPEHVCLVKRPVIFDRLEFNRAFRLLDVVDELSYLSMECDRLGASDVGRVLIDAYCAATGDRPSSRLRAFYSAHRACVRARLAVLHTDELERAGWDRWLDTARGYLQLAQRHSAQLALTSA